MFMASCFAKKNIRAHRYISPDLNREKCENSNSRRFEKKNLKDIKNLILKLFLNIFCSAFFFFENGCLFAQKILINFLDFFFFSWQVCWHEAEHWNKGFKRLIRLGNIQNCQIQLWKQVTKYTCEIIFHMFFWKLLMLTRILINYFFVNSGFLDSFIGSISLLFWSSFFIRLSILAHPVFWSLTNWIQCVQLMQKIYCRNGKENLFETPCKLLSSRGYFFQMV